jgi:hypothetical protein
VNDLVGRGFFIGIQSDGKTGSVTIFGIATCFDRCPDGMNIWFPEVAHSMHDRFVWQFGRFPLILS